MRETKFTRKELYDLVWAKPLSVLAKEYQISDNGLRKICKKMQIPLPPMGHWQKVRSGINPKRIALPDKYSGKNEVTLDERGFEDDSPIAKYYRLLKEISNDPSLPLKVPERLTNPDILIIETRDCLNDEKRCYNPHRGIIASRQSVLNIRVSRQNISRALRFMDALIKLLRARGHDVRTGYGETHAVVYGSTIEISVKEKLKYEMYERLGFKDYSAAGLLSFKIEGFRDRTWVDDKLPIEDKLSSILAKLELIGLELQEYRIRNEKLQKEREEKERIEREIRERIDNELQKFKSLFMHAARLHQANILRAYIETYEADITKNGNKSEEQLDWINWAKAKVEWYDPLINKEDHILNETHKTVMFKEFIKEWQ
jgi:hypothetical protein